VKIKFYTLYFSEIMVIFNCKERLKLPMLGIGDGVKLKKHINNFILVLFCLVLVVGVGCSNSKLTDAKNIETGERMAIDETISNYIVVYYSHILTNADRVFEAHKLYAIEQKDKLINVYIYTLFEGYAFFDGKFGASCGGTNPALLVLKKDKDKFIVTQFVQPKDGTEYSSSIKKMFPHKYTDKVMRDEGRDLGLESQIRSNAEKWLKAQGRDEVLSK
jgi:hypothetical protein